MNMRKTFSAAAIVAVLACSTAHAQVLGGGVGGAVNGALGGGLRDASVFGDGNASSTLGGQLDTGSMIDRTRGVTDQTTRRARDAGANARNRAESSVATTREASGKARNASANVVSSAASQLDTTNLSSTTEAAASQGTMLGSTSEPSQDEKSLELAPSLSGSGATQLDRVTGDANGSASGRASASRRGVAADAAAAANASTGIQPKQEEAQE